MAGLRALRIAAAAAGALGGLSGAVYSLLNEQSRRARLIIGLPAAPPPRADGVYLPTGEGPLAPEDPAVGEPPVLFAMIGDSIAAGLGVETAAELPAVLLAKALAEESELPVQLTTHAVSGSTSRDLEGQVDLALRQPPDLALVIIGGNDVTTQIPITTSAALLEKHVGRLRAAGAAVVAGTCPDLGAVRPIPQPLRSLVRSWSLLLAKTQHRAIERAGGVPVPLADLLSPEFLTRPAELFSADRFHPSAAGYLISVEVLLPALCSAIGVWQGGPIADPPTRSAAAEAMRPSRRIAARIEAARAKRATRFPRHN
ncbi:SGNH/GDSL hydrolase family protein [Allokutzneria multivorans]|uniref:SGNH/GDSL hydrolase family protein n=1 Tax=Allokutzneria multivorans TaxID=1142134 RepID=A0ABP7RM45_9PSEU